MDTPRELLESVELMVSELATNCVRHVQTAFELMILRTPEEIRVEVTDHGGGTPMMRSPGPEDPTGRGLRIVDMLSERWGVAHQSLSGKTVWFTLSTLLQAATRESRSRGQHAERTDPHLVASTARRSRAPRAGAHRVRYAHRPQRCSHHSV